MTSWRFRQGPGGITVALQDDERAGLASVLEQFRELLVGGKDPCLIRFQPPVHLHDRNATDEFWDMVAGPLLRHRLEAIETVEAGLNGATLDDDAVAAWMQTLNSVRLYLGDALKVAEMTFEPPEPGDSPHDAARYALYEWLGGLLDQLVTVAADGFPPGDGD